MTREDLLEHHRDSLETMSRTARQPGSMRTSSRHGWLPSTTCASSRLDARRHRGGDRTTRRPLAPVEWIAYLYLSGLQSELIDLLEGTLPILSRVPTTSSPRTSGATHRAACVGTAHLSRKTCEHTSVGPSPSFRNHGSARPHDDGESPSPAAGKNGPASGAAVLLDTRSDSRRTLGRSPGARLPISTRVSKLL